jgi:hypothetical protein
MHQSIHFFGRRPKEVSLDCSLPVRRMKPADKEVEYKRPGIGFWLRDKNKNPFFVIHEFLEGKFIQNPVVVERMAEFEDVDYTKAYLFEVESVNGKEKSLFRVKEVAYYQTQDGTEICSVCVTWENLCMFLLRFLVKTHSALSFKVPGLTAPATTLS